MLGVAMDDGADGGIDDRGEMADAGRGGGDSNLEVAGIGYP